MKRSLVIVSAAILLFFLFFVFVTAFESEKKTVKKQQRFRFTPDVAVSEKEINPVLLDIPQSYNDIQGVKKYLGETIAKEDEIKNLQVELQELKADNYIMRRQIAEVKNHPRKTSNKQVSGKQNLQAVRNSGLFFAGIAPEKVDIFGNGENSKAQNSVGSRGNLKNSLIDGTNSTLSDIDLQMQKLPYPAQTQFYSRQALLNQQIAVLKANDNVEDIYDLHNLTLPVSPYEIQAGSIIPAVLLTGINTSVAGTVVAQVRLNIYDTVRGRHLLIPKGSRIIGEYDTKISYGQRRVLIAFTRIMRPDGSAILVGKPTAADLQGEAGVEGNVNNHWGKVLGAATLSTILSVGAGVISDNSSDKNVDYRTAKQNAILGASSGISQVGQSLTKRAMEVQPTITIPVGFQFNIIVRRDMVLTPYRGLGFKSQFAF